MTNNSRIKTKIIKTAAILLGIDAAVGSANRGILKRCLQITASGLTGNYVTCELDGINENVLLYGTIAEYAMMLGLDREAKIYNRKFEDLVLKMGRNGKLRRLPA